MKIGKLYQVKELFWFLYPSKDTASTAATTATTAAIATLGTADPAGTAAFWSNRLKCNVSYISPKSIFCLFEKDGEFIKILTTNGELGWIWIYLADWCKKDIEEVKI